MKSFFEVYIIVFILIKSLTGIRIYINLSFI